MSPVAIIDVVIILGSLAAIVFTVIRHGLRRDVNFVVLALSIFTCVYGISLFIEWSKISIAFERLEDIVGATMPLWWAFVFYALRQELMRRALDESEQETQAANQQLRASNQQLGATNQQLQASEQQLRAFNQQLEASEKRFKQLFSEMTSGFALHEVICDDKGDPCDYRFIEVNPAFEKLTGLSRKDLIGKTVFEVIPETEGDWVEKLGRVAITGEPVHFENYSEPLGKHYEITAYSPDKGRFAVIFNNVTERKSLVIEREKLLKELNAKNKELQSIVYIASHDLRSPLVNIQGFSGELENFCGQLLDMVDQDKWDKEAVRKLIIDDVPCSLRFIRAGASKMEVLINGLLHLSRVGTAEMDIARLDANKIVAKAADAMRFQMQENNVSFTCDDLPNCLGDEPQVSQVFSNLIDNAMKYLNGDREGHIHVSGFKDGQMSVYCIEDNGIGIESEHQKKIFEIFHRLDPEGSVDGEGLGLTIVSRIIARQEGKVWLESEKGKGSKFFAALPNSQCFFSTSNLIC